MTSTSATKAAPTLGTKAQGGWLYGQSIDLLLGAGAGYVISIPLLFLLSSAAGLGTWPVALSAMFALLISGPHYGATILRVYEQRADRRKYALFAVWATVALCGLFVVGLNSVLVGSLLLTLYASWSPWHFAGQNYGVALMFLRRRGVTVEPRAKRFLYASFLLSFALTILVLHGEKYTVINAALPASSQAAAYRFMSLGIPHGFIELALPLTALAYVFTLVGAGTLLLRNAQLRDLGAASCVVLVQALWFSLPAMLRVMANVPLHGLAFAIIWISAAHGLQYLWVTFYFARKENPSRRLGPYLGRALLAGTTVTVFPAVIFAPGLLGRVPWDVGLAILLFSVVNLHHFILDGAIWKLRDGRIASLLLRDVPTKVKPIATPGSRRSWFGPVFTLLGVVSLAIVGLDLWEREFVINRAAGDLRQMHGASERLAWIGRDSPPVHTLIADLLAERQQPDAAMAEYQFSLDLYPTAAAWVGIGRVHASQGRWRHASEAFAAGLGVNADDLDALAYSSIAWMQLGRPDLARQRLEHALSLSPTSTDIQRELRRATEAEAATRRPPGTIAP